MIKKTCAIFAVPLLVIALEAQASAPVLTKIPNSNIDLSWILKTAPAAPGLVTTAVALVNPTQASTYQMVGGLIQAGVYTFAPQAAPFVGAVIGALSLVPWDLNQAYQWMAGYPALQSLIDTTFPPTTPQDDLTGKNIPCDPGNPQCSTALGQSVHLTSRVNSGYGGGANSLENCNWFESHGYNTRQIGASYVVYTFPCTKVGSLWYFWSATYNYTYETAPVSPPSGGPPSTSQPLSPSDYSKLGNALVNAIPTNASVRQALDQLTHDHPSVVPDPTPITQDDLAKFRKAQTATDLATQIATLTQQAAENPNDQAIKTALTNAIADQNIILNGQTAPDEVRIVDAGTTTPPDTTKPQKKELNFTPITSQQGVLMTKFPFSIINSLGAAFSVLYASPIPPNFTIDLHFTQKEIKFEPFNGIAATFRAIVGFLACCLTGWGCLRLFSRL